MPRQSTPEYWVQRIRTLKETENLGPKAIRSRLAQEDPDGSRRSPSSEKTIARKLKEYAALSDDEKTQYRLFSWPQSMVQGELPWEASRPLLELLKYHQTLGAGRPSVRLATWYWRLAMAVPDAHPAALLSMAKQLEAWDNSGSPSAADAVAFEAMVAFAPWRSEESLEAYRSAVARREIPAWTAFDPAGLVMRSPVSNPRPAPPSTA